MFVGDSLTGNWETLAQTFPKLKVANRGIGGDTSRGVLFRFREDVLDLKPRAMVLCIGSNDLSAHADPADVEGNIAAILAQAREHNPASPIVLCTIAPRANPTAPTKPGSHADLNARIKKLGVGKEHLVVLNFVPGLGTAEDQPIPKYFREDLLHLAGPGYQKWAGMLKPVLEVIGLQGAAQPPASAANYGVDVGLGEGGIEIDAGSIGKFTLGYPALF